MTYREFFDKYSNTDYITCEEEDAIKNAAKECVCDLFNIDESEYTIEYSDIKEDAYGCEPREPHIGNFHIIISCYKDNKEIIREYVYFSRMDNNCYLDNQIHFEESILNEEITFENTIKYINKNLIKQKIDKLIEIIMENNNYDKEKQYLTEFKNIFVYNFESIILNTSFYFLSAEKGMWRDGDKNLQEINSMDNAYKNNCINFLENQIMSVKSHMRDHEFDNKFMSHIIKNDTYDIVISEELLNAIKEVIIFKLNEKKTEFEKSIH